MPISPEVFETSSNRGTIVDSGTTLAYLAEEAYDPFINAVSYRIGRFCEFRASCDLEKVSLESTSAVPLSTYY